VLGATLVTTAVGPVEAAVMGSGPAVVLVHGTPGSWRQLVPVADDLAGAHTVVLPSRPGYGATPLAAGRTPSQQAAAYAALLDALGLERAAVVGVSGGGPSAAAFAADHPDRTSALVLCCPLALDRFAVPAALRLALAPGLGEVLTALDRARRRRRLADAAALEQAIRRELSPAELADLDDDLRAAVVRFLRSHLDAPAGLRGFRNDLAQARARTPIAGPVAAPTLVLHGDADTVVPESHGRAYADAVPGAAFETVGGAGHGFLLTRRAVVLPLLAHFLEEHR
jgi:pimeloyl-ACP methyl ester carboxylesterase